MIEEKKHIEISEKHMEALIESEKQEATGKIEYVTHEELKNHIEKILEDFDGIKGIMENNS